MECVFNEIKKAVKGKDDVIKKVLVCIAAGGHILLEDIPGVGKTTLAVSISKAMGLSYKRIQFTPDVLPSDVTGFFIYNMKNQEFEFKEGAVFCDILLADEINRTSPKTQSALLEAMEEGKVTVESQTSKLSENFTVIATQNPFGSAGTQRLPQSQTDRFMMRLSIGYPSRENEIEILKDNKNKPVESIQPVMTFQRLSEIKNIIRELHVDESIYSYIVEISAKTRKSVLFSTGISPRGSICVLKAAKALAYMKGRDYVTCEDVTDNFLECTAHRVELSNEALSKAMDEKEALLTILQSVKLPKGRKL